MFLKRVTDVLISPTQHDAELATRFVLAAIAIKPSIQGTDQYFEQKRVGFNGEFFQIYTISLR